ncbi:protein FAM104A-like isoform X5 [Peromyscus californicus insignis]|uniref:protein FAM104A-like isoform X5 n=1 Tax=Peromyscus californicus insignis TaxID=564181 RepID=UPI0022A72674|nr:protein FAM104A-like isoform X5 [Peromyscus californicus insignis]
MWSGVPVSCSLKALIPPSSPSSLKHAGTLEPGLPARALLSHLMDRWDSPSNTDDWKRRRDDNEEDTHLPRHSKRNKKDQAFQDPRAIESSSSDNERIHSSINNPNRESVPESSLNQNIAELNSNIPEFSHEDYALFQGHGPYSHINQILKEAHFYSLQQRGQSST